MLIDKACEIGLTICGKFTNMKSNHSKPKKCFVLIYKAIFAC